MEGERHENDKTRIDSSFCLLSGDVDLAKHLAEILPITCFVGEDWLQDFQPLDGGPVQSLSDAYSDYSVLLLIAAESEISVPEWLAHSEERR